eukprot:COSAG01_NODE_61_length_29729_cov_196.711779_22_plen_58_part_00
MLYLGLRFEGEAAVTYEAIQVILDKCNNLAMLSLSGINITEELKAKVQQRYPRVVLD